MQYLHNFTANVRSFLADPRAYWEMARANGYSNRYLAADAAITLAAFGIVIGVATYLL